MRKTVTVILLIFLAKYSVAAQTTFESRAQFDRTVHDFGDITTSDGPVSCSFVVSNVSNKPLTIFNVVSSCGCTDVSWTMEEIPSGQSGKISATYRNEDGPIPFDKALTVYLSDVRDPVILRLRGVAHAKKLPLDEAYPVHFGPLAFKDNDIKCGNLSQGQQKSGEVMVANTGKSPLTVTFKDVDDNLAIRVEPNPIPPASTARLIFTVTADRSLWGRNYYWATPLVDGRSFRCSVPKSVIDPPKPAGVEAVCRERDGRLGNGSSRIGIWAITKDDFSGMTREEKKVCPNPIFTCSTYSFGKIRKGTGVKAEFRFTNVGKSDLKIYKIDCDTRRVSVRAPEQSFAPGAEGRFTAELDTSGMPDGEVLVLLTLITNSPLRPIVTLYISGFVG